MGTVGDGSSGSRQWRLGLIGCGRFGRFCLEQAQGWERLRAVAVTDTITAAADATARDFGLTASATPEELFARDDVDLVLISTPPNTHHPLTIQALNAGKHVICEKPLGLTVEEADAMIAAAGKAKRLLVANHILRYNPLLEAVRQIIAARILGAPLHFFFENYAEDERLPSNHWFWDRQISGGIFGEHAVHFFDLYRWWLGDGEVLAAGTEQRAGSAQVDRVWCTVRHQGAVVGQQYHGFDQPTRLDRADHRILFERGDLTALGWIPMELRVRGIVNDEQRASLADICRECKLEMVERYDGPQRHCSGRGNEYHVTARVSVEWGLSEDKGAVYGAMLRAMFDDQLSAMESPQHRPRLTAADAREAVRMGVVATRLADAARGAK